MAFLTCACLYGLGCTTSSFLSLNELRRVYDLPPLPTAMSHPNVDAVIVLSTQRTEIYRQRDANLHTEREVHRVVKVLRNADAFREVIVAARVGETVALVEARHTDPSGATTDLKEGSFEIVPLESILTSSAAMRNESAALISPGFVAAYLSPLDDGISLTPRDAAILQRLESETHYSLATGPTTIASPGSFVEIDFPDVRPGSIIEYRCVFRRPSVDLFDQWYVQDYLPIQYSEYRLTLPQGSRGTAEDADWHYRLYRCARIGDPEVLVQQNPELERTQTYRWTLRDIAAFQPQIYMPAHEEELEFGRLVHSSWTHWEALATWYVASQLSSALGPQSRITALAESLVTGVKPDRDRIDRLRRFVQQLPARYRPLDPGNLTPLSSQEVAYRGGDSKDKAVLLVNLLRAVGIPADPALVVTKVHGGADPRFPIWNFDRMIVRATLGDHPLWIDAAARGRALGKLPWYCEGQSALVLPATGPSRFETIPESALTENQTQERIRIEVGAEEAKVDLRITATGEAAAQWRDFLRVLEPQIDDPEQSPAALIEGVTTSTFTTGTGNRLDPADRWHRVLSHIARTWISDFPDAVVAFSEIEGMTGEGELVLRFSFRTRSVIVDGSPWPGLHALPLDRDFGIGLLALESRHLPIEIGHRWKVVRSLEIDLTESPYEVQVVPSGASFESTDLRFTSEYTRARSRTIRGSQTWELKSPVVKTNNYDTAAQIQLALEAARGAGFGFRRVE